MPLARASTAAPIEALAVSAYIVPTATPEADGTFAWDRTTLVVAEAEAGGRRGLGFTYADLATASLIETALAAVVRGLDAMSPPAAWEAMRRAVRNLGQPGVAAMAISAVDCSLWDLKSRLLDLPLATLLGPVRSSVPIYGSGGFTSYSVKELQEQLGGWAASGVGAVKMKVGSDPAADPARVRAARAAVGDDVELFVDANGAYSQRQALALAGRFGDAGVAWFEEPVSSDDLEGLRLLRHRVPPPMAITAGEYGYDLAYFRRMLAAGAVDVLQPDATRCGGVTGFLEAAALCRAWHVPLSSHTAPSLHVHLCSAVEPAIHAELFFDHARLEAMLFDGAATPAGGTIAFDATRPGLGLELKRADADAFRV